MSYQFMGKFIRLTCRHLTLKTVLKQTIIAILLVAMLAVLFLENHAIFDFIVLLYLYLSGTMIALATKKFLNELDLNMLGFTAHTLAFDSFYIVQRYFRDAFIANSLVFIGLELFLSYQAPAYAGVLGLAYCMHFLLSPSEHLVFFNRVGIATGALVIKTGFLTGFTFLTIKGLTPLAWLVLISGYLGYAMIIYGLSFRARSWDNNFTDRFEDQLRLVKKVDLFLFRDVIFMYPAFFSSLVNLGLFMILFATRGAVSYYLIFVVVIYRGLNSFFIKKDQHKAYVLTTADTVFWNNQLLVADIEKVHCQKLKFSIGAWLIFSILGGLGALVLQDVSFKNYTLFILVSFGLMLADYLYMVVTARRTKIWLTIAQFGMYVFLGVALVFVKQFYLPSLVTAVVLIGVTWLSLKRALSQRTLAVSWS